MSNLLLENQKLISYSKPRLDDLMFISVKNLGNLGYR